MLKPSLTLLVAFALVPLAAACGGEDPTNPQQGTGGAGASGGGGPGGGGPGGGGQGGGGQGGGGGSMGACGDIPTFADGLTPAQELHVATNGSDAAGDGSAQSPFATIEHAASVATPGTAIRVHAGTYAGDMYIDGLTGEPAAPIWIGGAPGEARPVIDGGGEALHLTRARYVIVHDLEVQGQVANGLNVDDGGEYANPDASHHLLLQRIAVRDIGTGGNQDCLKLSGINDFFVLDSDFTACGAGGSAIDHVGCHRGVLARNTIHDLGGTGIQSKGGSEDIEIRWNRFLRAGMRPVNMGGSTGFEFFRPPLTTAAPNAEARDIRVLANLFVGGDAPAAIVGCVDCVFAANTVIDPGRWFLRILQETTSDGTYEFLPAQGGIVQSNLYYFERGVLSGEDINIGAGTDPASFVLANNLWYAHDDPGASAPANPPSPETGAVTGEDPAFADAAAGDYHIGAQSPAAGRGLAVPGLTGDLDGACYAMPPSIGAYEAR